tara:strand:- start:330 stop:746 length:417 start_codon:yes stop_codon:yes gene_type:complete
MGYVEQTLSSGEQVLYTARFHWLYTFSAIMALIFLAIVGIGIFIFLSMMITKWTTEIAVTNKRLIYKRGWIARKTDELSPKKIEEINVSQGVVGRILGFGKIRIQGTGGGEIVLPNIDDPLTFRREIENAKARKVSAA